jgi:hypothetical protein
VNRCKRHSCARRELAQRVRACPCREPAQKMRVSEFLRRNARSCVTPTWRVRARVIRQRIDHYSGRTTRAGTEREAHVRRGRLHSLRDRPVPILDESTRAPGHVRREGGIRTRRGVRCGTLARQGPPPRISKRVCGVSEGERPSLLGGRAGKCIPAVLAVGYLHSLARRSSRPNGAFLHRHRLRRARGLA